MSLTFGLTTAKELLEKLGRDAASLDDEVKSDRFFNFVVTGYSLINWVKHDPSVPATAKTQKEIDALYTDNWLKICGDLATAVKHFKFTRRVSISTSATSNTGYGAGRYGKGDYGVGEESIKIMLNDGTSFDALELVREVLASWKRFFSRHGV